MAKKNPKEKARKIRMVQQKKLDHGTPTLKYWLMGIVGLAAVIGIVIGLYYFDQGKKIEQGYKVETGDVVTMHYKLWIDDDKDGVINKAEAPYQEGKEFTSDMYSSYHEGIEGKSAVIYGYYINILGMYTNQSKGFEIPPCIDENGDGYDDNDPSKIAMGYGKGELANTTLYYWVKVLKIEKGEDISTGLKVQPAKALNQNTLISVSTIENDEKKYLTYA